MKNRLDSFMKEKQCTALDICIHQNGQPFFSYKTGSIDKKGTPLNDRSVFAIGSISKLFTAIAVMQLINEGKFTLDTAVYQLVPQFKMRDQRYKKITVEMLLNHSSGLESICWVAAATNSPRRDYLRQMIKTLESSSLKDEPGTLSVYCNDGYSLLELLIENVAKVSYTTYILTHICEPLHLYETEFPLFELADSRIVQVPNQFDLWYSQEYLNCIASGGIMSNASQLCILMDHLKTLVGSDELFEKMTSFQGKSDVTNGKWYATQSRFGFGLDSVEFNAFDEACFAKGGSTFGFSSFVCRFEQLNVSAAICVSCKEEISTQNILFETVKSVLKLQDSRKKLKQLDVINDLREVVGIYAGGSSIYQISAVDNLVEFYADDEKIEVGTFNGKLELRNFKSIQNSSLQFIRENNIVYMVWDTVNDELHCEERRILAQKLKPLVQENPMQEVSGQVYLQENIAYDQRDVTVLPLMMRLIVREGYGNLIFGQYPLQVLNRQEAIPFLKIQGHGSREMATLHFHQDDSFSLGQAHYRPLTHLQDLHSHVYVAKQDKIMWFKLVRPLDTVEITGEGRMLMLNEVGTLVYDSEYSTKWDETLTGGYIGFVGKEETRFSVMVEGENVDNDELEALD